MWLVDVHWKRTPATVALSWIIVGVSILGFGDSVNLLDGGAIVPGTLSRLELWRLIAAIFLHANVLHLLVNLWAFVQLAYAWELLFGTRRFVPAFFACGFMASVVSALFVRPPGSVGASGAIFGLVSSLIVVLRRGTEWRAAPWTRRLAWQLAIWGVLTVVMGFFSPRIDNAAHVGGLLAGFLVGWLVALDEGRKT